MVSLKSILLLFITFLTGLDSFGIYDKKLQALPVYETNPDQSIQTDKINDPVQILLAKKNKLDATPVYPSAQASLINQAQVAQSGLKPMLGQNILIYPGYPQQNYQGLQQTQQGMPQNPFDPVNILRLLTDKNYLLALASRPIGPYTITIGPFSIGPVINKTLETMDQFYKRMPGAEELASKTALFYKTLFRQIFIPFQNQQNMQAHLMTLQQQPSLFQFSQTPYQTPPQIPQYPQQKVF